MDAFVFFPRDSEAEEKEYNQIDFKSTLDAKRSICRVDWRETGENCTMGINIMTNTTRINIMTNKQAEKESEARSLTAD